MPAVEIPNESAERREKTQKVVTLSDMYWSAVVTGDQPTVGVFHDRVPELRKIPINRSAQIISGVAQELEKLDLAEIDALHIAVDQVSAGRGFTLLIRGDPTVDQEWQKKTGARMLGYYRP